MFLPHPRVKVSIVGSLRDREVACSASDRQGSNFESCVWRTVSSQSSHHPQEVLLAQFSLYVHKGGLKPESFHFNTLNSANSHVLHLCGTSWTSPKYTGDIHEMFVARVVTERKGFSSVLIFSKKNKTNQHHTLHLDPQRLDQSHYNKEMVVNNCMNIPKYTLIGYMYILIKWRVEKDRYRYRFTMI